MSRSRCTSDWILRINIQSCDVIVIVLLAIYFRIVGHVKASSTVIACDPVALKTMRRGPVDKSPSVIDSATISAWSAG